MCIVTDAAFFFPQGMLIFIILRMSEFLGKRSIKVIKIFCTSGVAIIIIVIIIVVVIIIIINIIIIIVIIVIIRLVSRRSWARVRAEVIEFFIAQRVLT